MQGIGIAIRLWMLALCAAISLTVACGDNHVEQASRTGRLQFALSGTSGNGAQYRLRQGTFAITGASVNGVSTEDYLQTASITVELQVGDYAISLNPGWYLEVASADGSYAPVEASLTSTNPQLFTIEDQKTSSVSFRFRVGGETIELGNGGLTIHIDVDDTNTGAAGASGAGGVGGSGGQTAGGSEQGGAAGQGGTTSTGGAATGGAPGTECNAGYGDCDGNPGNGTVTREMRLTTPPWESYFVGEPVTVSWSGVGREGDRLAIVLADDPWTEFASIATSGASIGGHPFDALSEGSYEAHLLDIEGRLIATSSRFTIVTLEPAAVSLGCYGLSWINDGHRGQWLTVTKSAASGGETLLVGHVRGEARGCMSTRFPPGDYVGELLDAGLSAVGSSAEFHVGKPDSGGHRFAAFTLRDTFYAHQPINFYWVSYYVPMDAYYYAVLDTATGTGENSGMIQVIPGFMEDGFVTAELPPGEYSMHIWDRWGREHGSSPPVTVLAAPVATDKETYSLGDPIELYWDGLGSDTGVLVVAAAGSMPWEFVGSCAVSADIPSSCTIMGVPVGHYEVRFMGIHSTNIDVLLSLDVSSPDEAPMP
ncbi:MAG TPA: hypothetical protein VIV60_06375 [Polyangiaceae bacterium]